MANILGLDIGDKRIGAAIADMQTPFPAPLTTLEASEHLTAEFKQLLAANNVTAVVIGLPRNQSGETTKQTERVRHIAKLLKIPKAVPVYWQDESLTSVKAEEELKRRKKPYAKAAIDSLAATYILEDFIRTQGSAGIKAGPETAAKQKHAKKPKKTKKHLLLKLLLAAAGVLLLAVIAAAGWYTHALSPRTKEDNYAVVRVAAGSTTGTIATELEEKKVIRSAAAFSLYVRLKGVNNLQAGEYRLSSRQSVKSIVDIIAAGKVTTVNVLVAPGLRLDQILETLKKDGYSQAELEAALSAVRSHPLLANIAQDAPLEGYLFPDTYQIGPSTKPEQLFTLMLNNFQKQVAADPAISAGLARQGLSFEQAVIIASVVQEEVPDYETQQKVAQVFLKRYKEGIPLGADPTFRYAAAVFGGPSDPSNSSPYNTRKYAGLPPTAISNFNLSALKAVANPSDTDYLYFVAGDDKVTYFSRTLEEHEALIEKHCTKLCN